MRLEFDLNNNVEMPEVILGKRNYDMFGSILNIDGLTYEYNLMSANSISFTVYKELNYEIERLWNEIKERRLIYLKEFNEWFQIDVVTNDNNGITKEITGTSLCEAELGQYYIRSAEINTEDDIARADYINPTLFYKPSNPDESLLHRLLKVAPNYTIKHVDESLWNIQRMFSIDETSVYDELTGEIAEEIGCLFLFDSTDRSISVYDLQTNCNHCGYRGDYTDICPKCGSTDLGYGYGNDTTIFVDSETLAESISLSGKQDDVKNCIKVSGGDDLINAAIAACNPTGTQYIYTWSDRDKEDMSEELAEKLEEYSAEYERLTPTYQDIMKDIYDAIDEQLKLESGMMPDIETAETNAKKELAKLTASNLSPIAVQNLSIASEYTVNNAVLGMAKCLVNSTIYKIEFIDDSTSFANQTWKGKFKLTNYSDEDDTAENTGYITITISDDYTYYIEQKIRKTIDRDDIYLVDIFDAKTDLEIFKAELKKYCLNRLTSFESAYQSVIDVLIEANCANTSSYGDIYNDLYLPYYNKLAAIQEEENIRISEIEAVEDRLTELGESQAEITSYLNLENFLGNSLWKELCSFRREDSFENDNYISDGLDNTEILEKAQELFDKAKEQAITASTLQMSLTTSMFNLLAIPEFKKLTGMFEGGNWIRVGLDDKIYRLRLIYFKIDFSEIQNIDVEFSDVTQTANGLNDTKSLMEQVSSMATNFNYVAYQAEQGAKSFTELDSIRNDGLNAALYNISSSVNQEFIIDEHGITGRQWDDIQGAYLPEQVKFTNNCLVYTDDYWVTAKSALGKIQYYNPVLKENVEQYGLLADAVIAGTLIGNDIVGGNIYSENYSTSSGTYINLNDGSFTFGGGKFVYDAANNQMVMRGVTIEWDSTTTPEITDIYGLEEQLSGIQDDLNQLDGRIQTYSQTSDPSTEWTTESDKQNHIGDLWYSPDESITQRWNGTTWEKTTDSDLAVLAQSKAQIFTTTPTPPYSIGDLWVQGSSGDILNCINSRTTGDYTASDWVKSSKYTDDSAAVNLDKKITQILAGTYSTTIGEDYIISPHIGGGYLNITDSSYGNVIIDPSNVNKSNYIFGVYNSSGTLVMGVSTSGNATFSGKITSSSGTIGGFTIGTSAIYKTSSAFGASGGMYFGISGLSIGSTFKVTPGGTVTANGTFSTGTDTYAKLGDGSLTFYRDNIEYSSFGTNAWSGTTTYGTFVHSESNAKFITFGNKTSGSDTAYITKFLINYGLNPNDNTQGVQVFSDLYVRSGIYNDGGLTVNSDSSISGNLSVTNGKLTVTGTGNSSISGNLSIYGTFAVSGSKSRIIDTEHYGTVRLDAYETATPYFGDIGSGLCDDDGICYIYIDDIFKETVIMDYKYYIFLQPIGESSVSLIEQNKDYFVVKGAPNQEFNFEIKCRQKGTEANRLDSYYEESEEID